MRMIDRLISAIKSVDINIELDDRGPTIEWPVESLLSVLPRAVIVRTIDNLTRPVEKLVEVEEQVLEDEEVDEPYVEERGGTYVLKKKKVRKKVPKFEIKEVVDEDGNPVLDSTGTPIRHKVPVTQKVKRLITVFEPCEPLVLKQVSTDYILRVVFAVIRELILKVEEIERKVGSK